MAGGIDMDARTHTVSEQAVSVAIDGIVLNGDLGIPEHARGIVLFAHGSGSSRYSPRNRAVATELQDAHFATLLLDLLTAGEELAEAATRHLRFDIALLATRLLVATDWLRRQTETRDLPIGYFGASTGAGAALVAAAHRPDVVHAVVSRGGRPDLAGHALADVQAPTLLIVGGYDSPVIDLNRDALRELRCVKQMEIIPRATHLFEEPGALAHVAQLARQWFELHLAPHSVEAAPVARSW
jgi:dienelactone hydrolase